ncbi:GNAT family N-acetyltransferase [Streptomyces sp. NPDC006670]|uniref:GNAT family N-acetyltransferase n=1 Tax=Streptomyces sp. NPDC006670 TaxID=3154476 RepID=UPI0033D937AB
MTADTAPLSIERVTDEASLRDWRHVHNLVIPPDALTVDEVRERAGRHLLDVAYLGDLPVGCTTLRRPTPDAPSVATVITRILPAHRGHGLGTALYTHALAQAHALVPGPDRRVSPTPDRPRGPSPHPSSVSVSTSATRPRHRNPL